MPPTQVSLEKGLWIDHQPVSSVSDGGPITFLYVYMYVCKLYFKTLASSTWVGFHEGRQRRKRKLEYLQITTKLQYTIYKS